MTVRVYRSSDASAPILTGTPGSLITLLDGCLVTGYGSSAAAGWSKAYSSGSTIASYRPGAGNRLYWYIDDTGSNVARTSGYVTMTSISAGSEQFPTSNQQAGGGYIYKSTAADFTPRRWMVIATEKAAHLIIDISVNAVNYTITNQGGYFFGDIISDRAVDNYATLIVSHIQQSADTTMSIVTSGFTTPSSGHFLARSYCQLGQSQPAGKVIDWARGNALQTYPHLTDGATTCAPMVISESNIGLARGTLPGAMKPLWAVSQFGYTLQDGDQFTFTTGELAGRTFELKYLYYTYMMYEISDTW